MAQDTAAQVETLLREIAHDYRVTATDTGITKPSAAVMAAIRNTPRHRFMSQALRSLAYTNTPLGIGCGQTISQPYIVAIMTDLLHPTADDRILEVGTGSGYQSAILSHIVKDVYTVEILPELARAATELFHTLALDNIHARTSDGYDGWADQAPFDGIMLTAATPQIPPPLLNQLKPGGRMVLPTEDPVGNQTLTVITRYTDGRMQRQDLLGVRFVPLTGKVSSQPGPDQTP